MRAIGEDELGASSRATPARPPLGGVLRAAAVLAAAAPSPLNVARATARCALRVEVARTREDGRRTAVVPERAVELAALRATAGARSTAGASVAAATTGMGAAVAAGVVACAALGGRTEPVGGSLTAGCFFGARGGEVAGLPFDPWPGNEEVDDPTAFAGSTASCATRTGSNAAAVTTEAFATAFRPWPETV